MPIAWRVGELAGRRGWNARQLAARAGVDVKTARNILAGRATRVDLDTIGRLSDALNVPPGALWRRVGERRAGDVWVSTAGAAGQASGDELDRLLRGEGETAEGPGLERAAREP